MGTWQQCKGKPGLPSAQIPPIGTWQQCVRNTRTNPTKFEFSIPFEKFLRFCPTFSHWIFCKKYETDNGCRKKESGVWTIETWQQCVRNWRLPSTQIPPNLNSQNPVKSFHCIVQPFHTGWYDHLRGKYLISVFLLCMFMAEEGASIRLQWLQEVAMKNMRTTWERLLLIL